MNQEPKIIQYYLDAATAYTTAPTKALTILCARIRIIKNFIRESNTANFSLVPKEEYLTLIPYLTYGRSKGHTLAVARYLYTNKDKTVLVISPQRSLYHRSPNLIVTSPEDAPSLLRGCYNINKIIFDSVKTEDVQKVIEASNPAYLPLMVRVGS